MTFLAARALPLLRLQLVVTEVEPIKARSSQAVQRLVERRASNWLEDEIIYNPEWLKKHGSHKIAVISHGITLRCLIHYITGMDQNFLKRTQIYNTSISRFRFGKNGWSIETINDANHTRDVGDIVRDEGIVQGDTVTP